MTWIRKIMRRRPTPPAAPVVQPEGLQHAKEQAHRAEMALRWVEAQDEVVAERTAKVAKIRKENNLGPAFMRVLKGKGDAGAA